ncbi:MAG TPA: GAF domain-containing protein, partial [Anaerolineae bacterium]|nr:GAF domain-containing protein [Anaerolineae bacterium]
MRRTTDSVSVQLGRVVVILLTALAFGLQAIGVYYDAHWHSIQPPADKIELSRAVMVVGLDLTITELRPGGEEIGFQVGDHLLSVGDQPVSTLMEWRAALNRQPVNTWTTVEVERGDEAFELTVLIANKRLTLRFFIRNLIAFVFILLGAVVAWQRFEDRAARLFFAASLALGVYFALLDKDAPALVYAQIAALNLAPALVIHFALLFPRERLRPGTWWWLLLYIPSAILLILTAQAYTESLLAGSGIWYAPRYATLNTIGFAYLTAAATFVLASMGYVYATTGDSVERRQLQWVMWGLGIAVASSFVDMALTSMHLYLPNVSDLLLLGTLALPLAFAFAILRYHLLDVDLVVNRSMVYAVLTAALAALYLLLITFLSNALGIAAGSGNYTIIVFISALLIGLLVNPLRARLQKAVDRLFFRQQLDFQDSLIRWSHQLSTSIRFSDVARLLIQEVPQQLLIADAWLLVLDEEESRFAALPSPGGEKADQEASPVPDLSIPASHPLAAPLLQGEDVLVLGEIGMDRPGQWSDDWIPSSWREAGVCVALPLISGGQMVGIYLVGAKLSGDIYQRQELDLLRTLANQAAIAIANARFYEQVHTFSQEMETKVRERTQELRDFISAVYHELSTPMTAIRGYTELLMGEEGELPEARKRRYLQVVHRNVQRLMRLVADLSDVARIEDGRLTIHPEPLRLRDVVQGTVTSLSSMVEEKGLRLAVNLDPEDAIVLGDEQRVGQILTNLLTNACRYTPAGGRITVTAQRMDGVVEITVRDTGIGIRADELGRIFDRFYRSDHPFVREQAGTGLGLAITKSLVEMHGSRLWVKSRVGQ